MFIEILVHAPGPANGSQRTLVVTLRPAADSDVQPLFTFWIRKVRALLLQFSIAPGRCVTIPFHQSRVTLLSCWSKYCLAFDKKSLAPILFPVLALLLEIFSSSSSKNCAATECAVITTITIIQYDGCVGLVNYATICVWMGVVWMGFGVWWHRKSAARSWNCSLSCKLAF